MNYLQVVQDFVRTPRGSGFSANQQRQAREAALEDDTADLLLITEAVEGIDRTAVDAMTEAMCSGIERYFGVVPNVATLSPERLNLAV
jgi:DNA/RNA-binding domain of Phe-tRNA-synthetase-like protein